MNKPHRNNRSSYEFGYGEMTDCKYRKALILARNIRKQGTSIAELASVLEYDFKLPQTVVVYAVRQLEREEDNLIES